MRPADAMPSASWTTERASHVGEVSSQPHSIQSIPPLATFPTTGRYFGQQANAKSVESVLAGFCKLDLGGGIPWPRR